MTPHRFALLALLSLCPATVADEAKYPAPAGSQSGWRNRVKLPSFQAIAIAVSLGTPMAVPCSLEGKADRDNPTTI